MKCSAKNSIDQNRAGSSRLYACIISPCTKEDREQLLSIAQQFSYRLEMLQDGILFDVGGLERLMGKPDTIAQQILEQLKNRGVSGNVAVAENTDTALLLARGNRGLSHTVASPAEFDQLPLRNLEIETDAIRIFDELGIKTVRELQQIPADDLIDRYGPEFRKVIDIVRQNGQRFLTPNVKDNSVAWAYNLDHAVDDFEQLIFIVNHGLDNLFAAVAHQALSRHRGDQGLAKRVRRAGADLWREPAPRHQGRGDDADHRWQVQAGLGADFGLRGAPRRLSRAAAASGTRAPAPPAGRTGCAPG